MDYRLYLLDQEGHVTERVDLECADDDGAVQAGQQRFDGRPMELWCRERRIKVFSATDTP